MDLKILRANKEDLNVILDLQIVCYQEEGRLHNDFNIPPLTQTIESIKNEFEKGTLFLKALFENQLVGSVRGSIRDGTTNIGRLIVKPEFQNKKIGQILMNTIECQLNDCERYELFTGFKSMKNLSLYGKLGYVEFKQQFVHDNLILVYLEKQNT
jgi:GNAT superfamily N-acetyltransferase